MVSGLPGSGKSWLALRLAPLLGLIVIDKDDILKGLFESKGVGDFAWRRSLSREADRIFRQEAEASTGALLVSFWHSPGMPPDSGTPTAWVRGVSSLIVNLHCECPIEVAAARFSERKRHAGHLDQARSREQILSSIRDLEHCKPLEFGIQVSVDTSAEVKLEDLVRRISAAFQDMRATTKLEY